MHQDFITPFADVHIGILGFTGLIGVLSHEDWSVPALFLRIFILLELGTAGLLFSLAPLPLLQMQIAPALVWQNLAGLMALLVVTHFAIFVPHILTLRRRGQWGRMHPLLHYSMLVFLLPCFAVSVVAALGFGNTGGLYGLGLLLMTMAAVFNFIGMLLILRERSIAAARR